MEKVKLKEDLVIPAGTEFERIPTFTKQVYGEGNYEALHGASKDSTIHIVIDDDVIHDNKEKFETINE